jgi:hypothetical protein
MAGTSLDEPSHDNFGDCAIVRWPNFIPFFPLLPPGAIAAAGS